MNHRLFAMTASAAVIVLAATGAALADPSGYVSLSVGPDHLISDYGFGEYSMDGYTVQGRASGFYDVTPVLGVQGDVLLTYDNIDNGSGDSERRAIDLALHGFYREADKFLIGTFVQLGRDGLYYNGNHLVDADRAYLGAEAQAYMDNLTLYVQGGLQQMSYDQSNAPSFDGWFGRFEARYFLTPDFRIDAHAGLSTLSDDNYNYEFKTSNIGFGAEYKFEDSPISLFAKYDFVNSKYDSSGPDASLDQHRILFGATFAIEEDTLLSRDRAGPSLDPMESWLMSVGSPN